MPTTAQRDLYIKRAVQLAVVYLTRRDDLQIECPLPKTGLSLLVTLIQDDGSKRRVFGVVATALTTRGKLLCPAMAGELAQNLPARRRPPFPVFDFAFNIDTDAGYWRRVRQPDAETFDYLRQVDDPKLELLTNAKLDKIIGMADD